MSRTSRLPLNADKLLQRAERSAKLPTTSDDRKMKIFMGLSDSSKQPINTNERSRSLEIKPPGKQQEQQSLASPRSSSSALNRSNPTISEASTKQQQQSEKRSGSRQQVLEGLFGELDIDRSGSLSNSEFFFLGQQIRTELESVWTWEFNSLFIKQITKRQDGQVQMSEFVAYFNKKMRNYSQAEWNAQIESLSDVAIQIRSYYKAGIFEEELTKLKTQVSVGRSQSKLSPLPSSTNTTPRHSPPASKAPLSPRSPRSGESSPDPQKENKRRQAALREVYHEFDLDGGGEVGFDELLLLGQTRRKLGQKQGAWTRDMNRSLMDKMGTDNNDEIPESNFVRYFNSNLTHDPSTFDTTMEQFLECARACRQKKIQKREEAKMNSTDQQMKLAAQDEARKKAEDEAREKAEDEARREARRRDEARRRAEDEAKEAAAAQQRDEDARRAIAEKTARRKAQQLEQERDELAAQRSEAEQEEARLRRERNALEREKQAWNQQKASLERQLAQDLRQELKSEAAKMAVETASQQRDRASLVAEDRKQRLYKLIPLVQHVLRRHLNLSPGDSFRIWFKVWISAKSARQMQQLQDQLSSRTQELGQLSSDASDKQQDLQHQITALQEEAKSLESTRDMNLKVRNEEVQIAGTKLLAKALNGWRNLEVRSLLNIWHLNTIASNLLDSEHQISEARADVGRSALKQRVLLRLLGMFLQLGARGLMSVRISSLINLWARQAVADKCQTLEWRLSHAKQLMPDFVPEIVWEWEDEDQKWHPYSRESCLQLEVNLANNPDEAVNVREDSGRMYKVWLNARKHVDVMSGQSRPCRRRAPAITYVTIAAGVRQYHIKFSDREIGFRAGMGF